MGFKLHILPDSYSGYGYDIIFDKGKTNENDKTFNIVKNLIEKNFKILDQHGVTLTLENLIWKK